MRFGDFEKDFNKTIRFSIALGIIRIIILPLLLLGATISVSTCVIQKAKEQKEYHEENDTTAVKELGKSIGNIIDDFKEGMEEAK